MTGENGFEPQIVAFCCHHCAYAAADLAGGSRMTYSPSLKIIELPCTGRVDILHVLHAFEEGADGVMVAGCLPGTCHYISGNLHARQRVEYLQRLLGEIGFEGERARMINVSAAMGAQFAEMVGEFTDTIKELGPNPLASGAKELPAPPIPGVRNTEMDVKR